MAEIDELEEQIRYLSRMCHGHGDSSWLWDVDEECDIQRRVEELEEEIEDLRLELELESVGTLHGPAHS